MKMRVIQKAPKRGKLTYKQVRDAVKAVIAKRKPKDIVQVRNPKTDRYYKIDRALGRILSVKKSPGKYKNIKVARKKKDV